MGGAKKDRGSTLEDEGLRIERPKRGLTSGKGGSSRGKTCRGFRVVTEKGKELARRVSTKR